MTKKVLLFIVLLIGIIIPVSAKGTNNFNAGDEITLHDPIGATSFTAGNNVSMDSKVDGANFVAGRSLNLKSIQDIIFAAGQDVNLDNAETKDAFLAGSTVTVKQSKIRDLYAAAETITVESDVRNAYLGADSITINSKIDGNADLAAENITIGDNAKIIGTLKYPEEAKITISDSAQVAATKTYKSNSNKEESSLASTIMEKIIPFITMLVTGLVLIALNKRNIKQIEEIEKTPANIAKTIGIGLLFLIVVPIASIFGLITIIGIPLTIIALIVYGILIYLSAIPTAYYLGTWLLKDKINNKYLIFIIVLLLIYILKLIPVLGGWVTFLTLCLGLGIDTYLIKEHITAKK